MDPIRTAVKYALIPLQIVVQLGEHFVGDDGERERPNPLGDANIAREVENAIFRDPSVAQGDIDVDVIDAVVWLRGQAAHPDMIIALEADAAAVPDVVRVENLLKVPENSF
jgi:osmotically-inducible protein OsmY